MGDSVWLGRGSGCRLSVVGCRLSVVGCRLAVAGSQVSRMADVMAQALGGNIGECRDERMQSSTPRHPPLRSDRSLRPIRRVGAPSPRSDRRTPAGTCAYPR
ncbi:hypothetical protein C2U63_33350 [Burkholderia pseudomallei]|nr:hypothetical protein C2U63_33350 [Burkholderia pseudomallei]